MCILYRYTYVPGYTYSYICIYTYANLYFCIHVYINICMYIHIHKYINTCLYIYVCVHKWMYVHIYMYMHMYIHMYKYTHVDIYIQICICLYIHIYTRKYRYVHMCTGVGTFRGGLQVFGLVLLPPNASNFTKNMYVFWSVLFDAHLKNEACQIWTSHTAAVMYAYIDVCWLDMSVSHTKEIVLSYVTRMHNSRHT